MNQTHHVPGSPFGVTIVFISLFVSKLLFPWRTHILIINCGFINWRNTWDGKKSTGIDTIIAAPIPRAQSLLNILAAALEAALASHVDAFKTGKKLQQVHDDQTYITQLSNDLEQYTNLQWWINRLARADGLLAGFIRHNRGSEWRQTNAE